MSVEFEHLDPPASEEQVARLEAQLCAPLPREFRDFLLRRGNGGTPRRNVFPIRQGSNRSGVRLLYGIDPGAGAAAGAGKAGNLLGEHQGFCARAGAGVAGFLPIGEDSFGNRIVLALRGDRAGAVYFWDHETSRPGARGGRRTRRACTCWRTLFTASSRC